MKRLWTDHSGKPSAMRVIAIPASWVGFATVVSSVVAMFMGNPQASAIAGTGAGIVIAALGLKWAQAKVEQGG